MRRWRFLIGCVGVSVLTLIWVEVRNPDGVEGLVLGALFEEDTQYAPGFSDSRFLGVEPGQSTADVKGALGEPLSRVTDDDGETWHFSRSPTDTHFRNRVVHFRNGVVTEAFAEFSVD